MESDLPKLSSTIDFGMVYAYTSILSRHFPRRGPRKTSLLGKMPVGGRSGLSWISAHGGFYISPGKKLLFMGQEFAQERSGENRTGLVPFYPSRKHLGNAALHALPTKSIGNIRLSTSWIMSRRFQWMDPDDAEYRELLPVSGEMGIIFSCHQFTRWSERVPWECAKAAAAKLLLDSSWKKFGGTREELKIYEAENILRPRETSFLRSSGYEAAIFSF